MARVLFTACPAFGHALPMLPLMRAAARAGHEVRVATGPDLVGSLVARGLDARAVGPTWASAWAAHDAVWADDSAPEEQRMLAGVVALFGTPALERLADLVAAAEQWRPDAVVHEMLEPAGALLADRLGVPGVAHGIGPMFPFYASLVGAAGAAVGEPGLWALMAAERAVEICPPALRPPGPGLWAEPVEVRPSAGEAGPLPPPVHQALAGDHPIAYFTLGTVKNAVDDVALGLRALAAAYDGVVVATTGRAPGAGPGRAALDGLPARVVLADFVPQAPVLARADLVVSHGGSGTMLGGLAYGVPQVALPRGADQADNAALLARAGAGRVVAPEEYGVEAIVAAVTQVARDSAMRAAAGRIRDEIAAMPDADAAWARLGF